MPPRGLAGHGVATWFAWISIAEARGCSPAEAEQIADSVMTQMFSVADTVDDNIVFAKMLLDQTIAETIAAR